MYKKCNTVYYTKGIYSFTQKGINIQINCIINMNTEHISFSTAWKYRKNKGYNRNGGKRILTINEAERRKRIRARDRHYSTIEKDQNRHHLYYSDEYDPDSIVIISKKEHRNIHYGIKNDQKI